MPTIQDIANRLGVSLSTVSRSLRQDRLIHPKTRAKVIEVALELGYQGRTRRRPSRMKHRPTLGVLLATESLEGARNSPNVTRYLEGITAEADATQVLLSLHAIKGEQRGTLVDPEMMPTMIRDHICDVLIVQGRQNRADIAAMTQYAPIVSINWLYEGLIHDTVSSDDLGGVTVLMDRLVTLGHRQFAWVPQPYDSSFFDARLAGMLVGCARHALPLTEQVLLEREGLSGPPSVINPAALEPALRRGVTAFVAANDQTAMATIKALAHLGIDVPGDASVVGFDAIDAMTPDGRTVTTADPQFIEMGRQAVRLALQRLAQPAASPISVRPVIRFVEGQTIGPAKIRKPAAV